MSLFSDCMCDAPNDREAPDGSSAGRSIPPREAGAQRRVDLALRHILRLRLRPRRRPGVARLPWGRLLGVGPGVPPGREAHARRRGKPRLRAERDRGAGRTGGGLAEELGTCRPITHRLGPGPRFLSRADGDPLRRRGGDGARDVPEVLRPGRAQVIHRVGDRRRGDPGRDRRLLRLQGRGAPARQFLASRHRRTGDSPAKANLGGPVRGEPRAARALHGGHRGARAVAGGR